MKRAGGTAADAANAAAAAAATGLSTNEQTSKSIDDEFEEARRRGKGSVMGGRGNNYTQ